MYIDLDTGTVVWIDVHDDSIPPIPGGSDDEIIDWAIAHGVPLMTTGA